MIAFPTLGVLCVLGANPLLAAEETRAKDAKLAKVKGTKYHEILRGGVESAFALQKKLDDQRTDQ